MKRLVALAVVAISALAGPAAAAHADSYPESLCQERAFLCLDPYHSIGANGEYTGHDEPTVQFSSNRPGTGGKDLTYFVRLPKNAPTKPNQAGTGGTWDFQRRATFWFSITMCDTQSSPNFTHKCKPNSDANARFRSNNPNSPHYIGKSPGNAFMELQFYTARLGPAVRGLRLQRHEVVRQPDHRQPLRPGQHRRQPERRLPEQPLPRRRGAHQLGVHHEERQVAGARQPAGALG